MKLFLLAGELSGDKLGAALMAGLKDLTPDVTFAGVGGPGLVGHGLESLFPMEELSVMGIAEVLPKYPALKRRLNQATDAVLAMQPDALITIDSPDFSFRLAKAVKAKSNIKTIHYVAPSVWAWRPGRAEKMARHIDHVLALLPFEPPYMTAAGMTCDFVGHPVVEDLVATIEDAMTFRENSAIGDAPLLLALPGSRLSEVRRLSPVFGATIERVAAAHPDLRVVLPAAAPVASDVRAFARDWPGNVVILDAASDPNGDRKRAAFRAADVALAASGTVSLELAANGTPMVVAYDMNWLSWQIMSRMASVDTVTLVNLISESRVIPEFLGPKCKPPLIADAVVRVLSGTDAREAQKVAMFETMEALGKGAEAPGLRAARSVLNAL